MLENCEEYNEYIIREHLREESECVGIYQTNRFVLERTIFLVNTHINCLIALS
jgi:hypothetical protein